MAFTVETGIERHSSKKDFKSIELSDNYGVESKACCVYALFSTENGEIRYIGQTTKRLSHRLKIHVKSAMEGRNWPLCKWIRKTLQNNYLIQSVILIPNAVWNETEIKLIAGYLSNGARLLNCTAGGEGFVGLKRTIADRRKMSDAGKKHSIEHKRKISEGLLAASKKGKEERALCQVL